MKMKLGLWMLVFACIVCCCKATELSSKKVQVDTDNSIVFISSYEGQKGKWQGPYHNKLLYPKFCAAAKAPNRQQYQRLIKTLRRNGVEFIGYYYSATTSYSSASLPEYRRFPEVAIPPELVQKAWLVRSGTGKAVNWYAQKDRYYVDVGIPEVQNVILKRAIGNAQSLGLNGLFLDNWYYKYWSPSGTQVGQWTEKCLSFLIRARQLTKENNLKLVVNTSSPPKNWPEFASHLDGIAYELGAHPQRLKSRQQYQQELDSYQHVIDMGKSVFLYTDRLTDGGERWDKDGRKVALTAMLVMPEKQNMWGGIYVCPPRYEVWPVGGWPMWPEQLGKPLGQMQWRGDTVTRRFEHGYVSVTIGEKPKFNIAFEY